MMIENELGTPIWRCSSREPKLITSITNLISPETGVIWSSSFFAADSVMPNTHRRRRRDETVRSRRVGVGGVYWA